MRIFVKLSSSFSNNNINNNNKINNTDNSTENFRNFFTSVGKRHLHQTAGVSTHNLRHIVHLHLEKLLRLRTT